MDHCPAVPLLEPRPTLDVPVPVAAGQRGWHLAHACLPAHQGPPTAVPVGQLTRDPTCGFCLHRWQPSRLRAALAADDRQVAITGLMVPASLTLRLTGAVAVARAVLQAGPSAAGPGGLLVAAVPLPVARWVTGVLPRGARAVRVRTIDAAGLVPTTAALWRPGRHAEGLSTAVRAARRLAG